MGGVMMSESQWVERYTLKIMVISPTHIGTGDRLDSKSRLDGKTQVYVADETALLQAIADTPTLLPQFERFCLGTDSLGGFLKTITLPPEKVMLYGVPRWGNNPIKRDYFPFIKSPERPPRPYIPGSSLKGAVRSAFLRAAILGDEKLRTRAAEWVRQSASGSRVNPKRADDTLDKRYFSSIPGDKNWQNYDWMRLFQFTDAFPGTADVLAATETHLLSLRGDTRAGYKLQEKTDGRGQPMTQNPEVLRPGVVLTGELTLLLYLLSASAAETLRFREQRGSIAYLVRQCNVVAQEQIMQELTFAEKTGWSEGREFYTGLANRWAKLPSNACLLRLGWGAGYDDKTITDQLDEDTFETVRQAYARSMPVGYPGRSATNPPLAKEFSPKSRKVALDDKGRWLPLGWLRVELQL